MDRREIINNLKAELRCVRKGPNYPKGWCATTEAAIQELESTRSIAEVGERGKEIRNDFEYWHMHRSRPQSRKHLDIGYSNYQLIKWFLKEED